MIGGFFAIPNAAARVCVSPEDTLALYWCCRQADAYGWGTEFDCSNTMLQDAAGGSRSWAQRWVVKMVRVGSLVVTDPGHRHKMRVVLMPSPFGKVDHHEDHHEDHHTDHQSNARKRANGKSGPPPGPPPGPPVPQFSTQTKTTDLRTRPIQDVWDHWRTLVKGYPKAPGASSTKSINGWLAVTDAESICTWLSYCMEAHPYYRREKINKFAVFMRAKVREDGLVESNRWHESGRPAPKGGGRTPQEQMAAIKQIARYSVSSVYIRLHDRSERLAAMDAEAARLGWPTMRDDLKAMGSSMTKAAAMTPRDIEQLTKARR